MERNIKVTYSDFLKAAYELICKLDVTRDPEVDKLMDALQGLKL